MEFSEYFPVWDNMTPQQQQAVSASLVSRSVKKGTLLHNSGADCTGLLLIKTGRLRAFILSKEGREVTFYRLFDQDICLFSASCILCFIQFDVAISAEKDMRLWIIPLDVYQQNGRQEPHKRPCV